MKLNHLTQIFIFNFHNLLNKGSMGGAFPFCHRNHKG